MEQLPGQGVLQLSVGIKSSKKEKVVLLVSITIMMVLLSEASPGEPSACCFNTEL